MNLVGIHQNLGIHQFDCMYNLEGRDSTGDSNWSNNNYVPNLGIQSKLYK